MANLVQLGMLEKLDGFLLVDKPEGIQFSTVVKTVKRKFNLPKVCLLYTSPRPTRPY